MPRRWKEISTVGDRSPVDHGGGVVFKRGRNEYTLVYVRVGLGDLPGEFIVEDEDGGEGQTILDVLLLDLPKTFKEFREAYGEADWKGAAQCCGPEEGIEPLLREMRFAKGDEFVKKAVWLIEMLIMAAGTDSVGGNMDSMTADDLEELFKTGEF